MKDNSFAKTIMTSKSPAEAYGSIMNFRGWWSEEIEGNTDQLNEAFFYHYKDIHLCKIGLIEASPGKKLVYHVIENEFNFIKDKTEWVGTRLVFDISTEGDQTKIVFTHDGLVPDDECYQVCNEAWSSYIGTSLKNFIDSGKGNPNPKGKEGFNAALAAKWGLQSAISEG